MTGLGDLHHPVSTKNPQAQEFFDQGLRFIFAFNHDEAARSFQHAAELDPKLAMAFWGVAEAVGPNYNDPADPDRGPRQGARRMAPELHGGRASADELRKRAMAMQAVEIERLIKAALPDASVEIRDLAGDGDHYSATVISPAFRGKSRVQQHQIVYKALQGRMGGELHALALTTAAPQD